MIFHVSYYDITYYHLQFRVAEYSLIFPITGKKSRSREGIAVRNHMLVCTNFDFDLATNEILLISYNNPGLSKNTSSLSVYDFDYSIVSLDK